GYPTVNLNDPVNYLPGWQDLYRELITVLSEKLSEKVKKTAFIEIIFMSYSFVHRKINEDAFPDAPELYDKELMQVRGRGKYGYHPSARQEGELFFRAELARKLPHMKILYFS
ncbi:MAG: spore photoproduct lyase family protein, partial [Blautia coccoides]